MSRKFKRSLAVMAIVAAAFIIGFICDRAYTAGQKRTYPRMYNELVEKYSAEYGVPEQILYATIKTESNFRSDAVSRAGAVGLMQLMPDTFDWISDDLLGEHLDNANAYDPDTNIRYGTFMLSWLYRSYGDWELVFAAYNAGAGNVNKWLADDEYSRDGRLTYIPFDETRAYVKRQKENIAVYEKLYYDN